MKEEIKKIISSIHPSAIRINDVDQYITKIIQFSTIISITENEKLSGFISYYNNDIQKEEAFLSLLAIDPDCQGKGLGKRLLMFSISDLKHKGFKNYCLEVLKDNISAINLYKNFHFIISEDRGSVWLMKLEL